MKINKTKVKKALAATNAWIAGAEARGAKDTFETSGGGVGFTILWCEKRNAREYEEMLRCDDTKELDASVAYLYKAI